MAQTSIRLNVILASSRIAGIRQAHAASCSGTAILIKVVAAMHRYVHVIYTVASAVSSSTSILQLEGQGMFVS